MNNSNNSNIEMANGSAAARAAPKQLIKKTIQESVTTGPGQQYPYPMNATGRLMKNVDTGNGKGKFSHSLTDRQSQMAMSSGQAITYSRSYKINAINPKYVAAQSRAQVNELSGLFGQLGKGKKTRHRRSKHKTHRRSKHKTHRRRN